MYLIVLNVLHIMKEGDINIESGVKRTLSSFVKKKKKSSSPLFHFMSVDLFPTRV